jgi:hypothetical protein
MRRSHSQRKGTGKRTISIIVDGKTEIWYLQMMKKNESLNTVNIKPELPKKKQLKELYGYVIENSIDYNEVIWIIDFDTILKEDKERASKSKSKIVELKEYLDRIKMMNNVTVLINTPCLEYWYLQHFKESGIFFENCSKIDKEFKNTVLKDYEKSERYYKRSSYDIYQMLKPYRDNAIKHSKKLGDFNIESPKQGKAEMYKIFDILNIN